MKGMKRGSDSDNRGITLTEMIITFALVGIFMAAAVSVITSAVITNSELTASMYAQSVGEMLLDKVTGELAAAQAYEGCSLMIGDTEKAGGTQGNGVAFYDRDGKAVLCMVQDGLLKFRYQESVDVTDQGEILIQAQQDWTLDAKAYMGFRITDMQIARANEENVIEVKIKIKNLKTGFEYATSRCTKCYNFKTENDYRKIVEDSALTL